MSDVLSQFRGVTGPNGCLTDATATAPFMHEWRGRMQGEALAVLLPQTTAQVADIVKLCLKHQITIVPQGGNTGLVGAGVPDDASTSICLSLKRMNAIRSVDATDFSMVAEAGCILQNAKEAAAAQDRLLAMTLASEGSASIGGLIATNAGGSFTLRYGNMRALVLGLEVVLPDGRIWNGLRSLHKNNSGYDIKQLLIGSEGTLGIITAATLKLLPLPSRTETALIALPDPNVALQVLAELRVATLDMLAAFELMPDLAINTACTTLSHLRKPFSISHPWYALVETHLTGSNTPELLAPALAALMEKGLVLDAAIAESQQQAKDMWALREGIVEAQKHLGPSLKHDLSVPVAAIPALIAEGSAALEKLIPGARPYLFGHVGDGNIHFNISQPDKMSKDNFLAQREAVATMLHDITLRLGGSISAEHGIGRFKRDEFHRTVNVAEFEAMRAVKRALDPEGIMNPGVIF